MATITSNSRYIEIDGRTAIALSDNAVVNLIATGVRIKFMSGSYTDIGYEGTTVDGAATTTAQELYDWFKSKGFSSGGGAPGEGVQSIVAGAGVSVDDSDPANPVISTNSAAPDWGDIQDKPAVIASGATQADARSSIGLGTASTQASGAFATAAQGALADTAVQPSDTSDVADAGKVVKYSNIGAVNTVEPQFPENAVPLWYFNAGLDAKQNALSNPSQVEAEAGTAATARSWSAQRDRQAIVAASRLIVSVSANKILALTDEYTYQRVTAAATITIPTNASVAFPVGAEIDFFQAGSGAITFSPSSGVTVNSFEDTLVTDGKGAAATLKKVAANEWDLII